MNSKDEKEAKTVSTGQAVEETWKLEKEPKADQERDLDSSLEEDTEGMWLKLVQEQAKSRRAK